MTEPSTKWKAGLGGACFKLSTVPVERSSTAQTSCPCDNRASTRCEPMKPAPPVTRTRILLPQDLGGEYPPASIPSRRWRPAKECRLGDCNAKCQTDFVAKAAPNPRPAGTYCNKPRSELRPCKLLSPFAAHTGLRLRGRAESLPEACQLG